MKFVRYVLTLALSLVFVVCADAAKVWSVSPHYQPQRQPKEVTEIAGTIERWIDGDNCFFIPDSDPGQKIRIRLFLVDAPESDQPGGALATEYVRHHPQIGTGKHVILGMVGTDNYKRTLGELKGVTAKEYCTAELLASGYFWPYYPALQHDISQERADELEKIFNATKAAKKGIFKYDNPIQPYLWRKMGKDAKQKARAAFEVERRIKG